MGVRSTPGNSVVWMRIAMDETPVAGDHDDDPPGRADDGSTRWAAQVFSALHAVEGIGGSALRLIYQQHLTQAQAAVRLGVAESTVKIQVARALRQLAAKVIGSDAGTA